MPERDRPDNEIGSRQGNITQNPSHKLLLTPESHGHATRRISQASDSLSDAHGRNRLNGITLRIAVLESSARGSARA
jgi:hypothetical protein